ncbi:MAG: hypothetical protein A2V70_00160 [Planctomycetes bacterium RBG_13_63_9]|nr:MAG: hypothetical protein A2V70_00160 [Planctomycetes bacterium RBG_13_63_9]
MSTAKTDLYRGLAQELLSLVEGERDFIANAANLAALLFYGLPEVNWVGFYLLRQDELVLGPFQGRPACVRIPLGKGVCGTAAQRRETILVEDVHEFPGHITCDCASNSEIVVPIVDVDCLIGVLDVDSPLLGRFDGDDRLGLESLVETLVGSTDFGDWGSGTASTIQ